MSEYIDQEKDKILPEMPFRDFLSETKNKLAEIYNEDLKELTMIIPFKKWWNEGKTPSQAAMDALEMTFNSSEFENIFME